MLIRTQNKQNIFNFNSINGIGFSNYYQGCELFIAGAGLEYTLGQYSSKEKALKVLDMIEAKYLEPVYISDIGGNEYAKYEHKVFHMPTDDEVEINE